MLIRKAKTSDVDRLLVLLQQVLQIHADIRPDIFIPNTTKYTKDELIEILGDESRPIYVAVDESDRVLGYAFCQVKTPAFSTTMINHSQLYIDDLCVDKMARGTNIGRELFEYVKAQAKAMGCYEVTLCVWTGNDAAEKFYEKMGMQVKEKVMEFIL
ncbi:MAG: GNAT family N-acetyltransferase [Pseudobutyrivibrio sp.]|nr:GNAT family N-acetyltransferase [Pseudobutyrivibrio sp.]